MKNSVWTLVAVVMVAGPVWAGQMEDVFGRVSVDNADKAEAILRQQVKGLGCKEFALKEILGVTPVAVTKNADGKGGRWMARYGGMACGNGFMGNVYFDFTGEKLKMSELVPGNTLADPELQKDTRKSLGVAVARAMPQCTKGIVVRQTQVMEPPAKEQGRWKELWQAHACGREIGQVIEFVPNTKGVGVFMAMPTKKK